MNYPDRHQGQLVTADGSLEPAALPPSNVDVSIDGQAAAFLNEHPRVLTDLIMIMSGYAAHPSCTAMPVRLAWEQLRFDYKHVHGLRIRLPNNFVRPVMERLVVAKPEWSHLLTTYVQDEAA